MMVQGFSPSKVFRNLRAGPAGGEAPTADQVAVLARRHPDRYEMALTTLLFRMADEQMKNGHRDVVNRYIRFSRDWRGKLNDEVTRFYFASLDVHARALRAGLGHLDSTKKVEARRIAEHLTRSFPGNSTVEGIAWHSLVGQIQSVYSRNVAAETFMNIRRHDQHELISRFYRDTGALTYFCEDEVLERKRVMPSLTEMSHWSFDRGPSSPHAIIISVDPHFFRIYGPMLLFNAQQVSDVDFVVLLSGTTEEGAEIHADMQRYFTGLTKLNKQAKPDNVRLLGLQAPAWVANIITFYASARFMVLPDLLKEYEQVYAMDADLFLTKDPSLYFSKVRDSIIGLPYTEGLAGVAPWRRYMAGNLIAERSASTSEMLRRTLDYLSVGLQDSSSWMLDQNALAYGVEGALPGEFTPISQDRLTVSGRFMARWERNYKASLRN